MNPKFVVRLLVPLIIVGFMLLMVGGIAAWFLHSLQKKTSQLLDQHINSHQALEKFDLCLRDIRFALCEILIESDASYLDEANRLYDCGRQFLDQMESRLEQSSSKNKVLDLKSRYQRFGMKLKELTETIDITANKTKKQIRLLVNKDLHNELRVPGDALLDDMELRVKSISEQNRKIADRMALVLLLLGSCGALAGLLTGIGLSRGIRRSVTQLSIPVHDAAGQLSEVIGPVTIQTPTGIEDLESGLNILRQSIATLVERLQQSEKEVLRAEQLGAIGQLAAGLAHELRNPLMAIKVLVQSAQLKKGENPMTDQDLALLEEEISRMNSLLQTFLDFARPQEPILQSTTLQSLLDQQINLITPKANLQKVTLNRKWPSAPIIINADVNMLRQLFLNLFLNALEAMPLGGTLSIEIPGNFSAGEDSSQVTVRVIDSGPGLPDDLKERLFEPFVCN